MRRFLAAAGNATPEIVNFMPPHGRGELIALHLPKVDVKQLVCHMCVHNNTDPMEPLLPFL